MAVSPDTLRLIFGIIGNITSLTMFTSPVQTMYKVYKWKSTKQFSPVPYVATFLNCSLWVLYGLPMVHPHSLLIITINGAGVFLQIIFISLFIFYTDKVNRRKALKLVGLSLVFLVAVAVLTLTLAHTHKTRSLIAGSLSSIFCICMYASPLSVMMLVIRTKSVKYMPLLMSVAGLCNGVIWTAYAALHFDIFVTIPNSLGALLAIGQLVLYGIYYKTTNWKDDEEEKDKFEDATKPNQNGGGVQQDLEMGRSSAAPPRLGTNTN